MSTRYFTAANLEPTHRRLVISSEHEHLDRIVDETEAFVQAFVDDEDFVYRAVFLTTEAVTNAMEHGNAYDPAKRVIIDFCMLPDEMTVTVEDQGAGFEPSQVVDPLQHENLLNDSGRGVFLLEQMADEVAYDLGGRRVRFVLKR